MAKDDGDTKDRKDPKNLPRHPPGDTSANDGVDGGPPPTWDPGKTTQLPVEGKTHGFFMTADEDGRTRWECSCGEAAGRWGKSADREFYEGWRQHVAEVEGS